MRQSETVTQRATVTQRGTAAQREAVTTPSWRIALAWGFVGLPLAWGFVMTLRSALQLFG